MNHQTILIAIFSISFLALLFYTIKNKPAYLVIIGIRSLFSYVLIQFINYVCAAAQLSVPILANPVTIVTGGLLGFPGILLLYVIQLYFL